MNLDLTKNVFVLETKVKVHSREAGMAERVENLNTLNGHGYKIVSTLDITLPPRNGDVSFLIIDTCVRG